MPQYKSIPEDVKRLILKSIDSVPHLEVLLLLHQEPETEWSAKEMALRLFIQKDKIDTALEDLCSSGFAVIKNESLPSYQYSPATPELKDIIARLAEIYSKNIILITHLIHSKINKQAQQFGDAFKWQRDKE